MAPKAVNKTAAGKKESKVEHEKAAQNPAEEATDRVLSAEEAEELEEQQEASSSETAQNGNAAALAAASSTSTESASFKNFRHHPDMENFYRFIFENDLRHEALGIIDQIMQEKSLRKQVKLSKAQPN